MADDRRAGDNRPLTHDEKVGLTFLPAENRPIRWLPKHGQPYCVLEWFSQHFIKTLAYWPVYTAVVVTLMFIVILTHPFGLGR